MRNIYEGENKKLVLNEFGKQYRTRLRQAIVEGKAQFAGKYLIARWGCGSEGCNTGAVIDASKREAFGFPVAMSSVWPVKPEFSGQEGQELIYKIDSRLIIFAGNIETEAESLSDSVLFYEFTGKEFTLLKTAPYGKSMEQ